MSLELEGDSCVFVFAQPLGCGFASGVLSGPEPDNRPSGRGQRQSLNRFINLHTGMVYLVRHRMLENDDGVGIGRIWCRPSREVYGRAPVLEYLALDT